VFFADRKFIVKDGVYEPAEDTVLIADSLQLQPTDNVLDIGTGCGILAVLSAFQAEHVVAVDINPCAARCAKLNARLNCVSAKVEVIRGDLFEPLKDTASFDMILFNAPYLPTEKEKAREWIDYAWSGGETGRQVIDRFVAQAPRHLKPDGRILLVQSTLSNNEKTLSELRKQGLESNVTRECKAGFETITLIQATKKENSQVGDALKP
jgi:release factor glutamine methyltransferase